MARETKSPRKTILVAEDDELVRTLIRRSLEQAGYDVHEAADGDQALAAVRDTRFDLVITDIVMPEKDGLEMIIYLRKAAPQTSIIAISGIQPDLYLENAALLGATRTLSKPFTSRQLLQIVSEVLTPTPA